MRQVTDGRKGRIVGLGGHAGHPATQRGPDFFGFLQLRCEGSLDRGEDDLTAAVKLGIGVFHTGNLAPCNRVGRHKRSQLVAQRAPGRLHHVGLGGTHVHDQHLRSDKVLDGLERGLRGGDWHGQQHNVGPCHGQQGRWRLDVNHAQLAGAVGGGGRFAVAHHPFDEACLFHCQSERASHEAAADQSELFKHGGLSC